jgi:hypothetical protein
VAIPINVAPEYPEGSSSFRVATIRLRTVNVFPKPMSSPATGQWICVEFLIPWLTYDTTSTEDWSGYLGRFGGNLYLSVTELEFMKLSYCCSSNST